MDMKYSLSDFPMWAELYEYERLEYEMHHCSKLFKWLTISYAHQGCIKVQ